MRRSHSESALPTRARSSASLPTIPPTVHGLHLVQDGHHLDLTVIGPALVRVRPGHGAGIAPTAVPDRIVVYRSESLEIPLPA